MGTFFVFVKNLKFYEHYVRIAFLYKIRLSFTWIEIKNQVLGKKCLKLKFYYLNFCMYFTYFCYGAHSLIIIYYLVVIDKNET